MQSYHKPDLKSLCVKHRVDVLTLANASGRHPLIVWDMLVGNQVSRLDAHLILSGLNRLRATMYDITDVYVTVR